MPFQPKGFLFCQLHSTLFINIRSFDFDFFFYLFPLLSAELPLIFLSFQVPLVFKISTALWKKEDFFLASVNRPR